MEIIKQILQGIDLVVFLIDNHKLRFIINSLEIKDRNLLLTLTFSELFKNGKNAEII